mmetsp:Transcript_31655/g.105689  ORF Transcript_31655/g.105689 Transcript_31655/m.105689 type:complete len:320 (-) Transcript_31655:130-1089(-)
MDRQLGRPAQLPLLRPFRRLDPRPLPPHGRGERAAPDEGRRLARDLRRRRRGSLGRRRRRRCLVRPRRRHRRQRGRRRQRPARCGEKQPRARGAARVLRPRFRPARAAARLPCLPRLDEPDNLRARARRVGLQAQPVRQRSARQLGGRLPLHVQLRRPASRVRRRRRQREPPDGRRGDADGGAGRRLRLAGGACFAAEGGARHRVRPRRQREQAARLAALPRRQRRRRGSAGISLLAISLATRLGVRVRGGGGRGRAGRRRARAEAGQGPAPPVTHETPIFSFDPVSLCQACAPDASNTDGGHDELHPSKGCFASCFED